MTQSRFRFPLMALAIATLFVGVWAGILRLGWNWPTFQPGLAIVHGPLMISSFLGTLIGIERAVALGSRWVYTGPVLTALGGIFLMVGVLGQTGALLITLGSAFMVGVFAFIIKRVMADYTIVMGIGSVTWLIGNLLWLTGWPIYQVVMWWASFLILTITGERLELSRIVSVVRIGRLVFLAAIGLFLIGLVVTLFSFDLGVRLAGVGMLSLGGWLLKYDVATRTVRKPGLTRFMAVCLLIGNLWLVIAGVMAIAYGGVAAGLRYDSFIHAIYLGFVFSMIFGHAPIIIPAVLGVHIFFHPVLYLHVVILQLSLIYRVAGNHLVFMPARMWGGLVNGVAILLFLIITAVVVIRSKRLVKTTEKEVIFKGTGKL